jgi:hypothetical protein
MNRLIAAIVLLYPRKWRRRYLSEFQALLEDLRPNWIDCLDILRSALKMRIHLEPWPLWKTAALFSIAGAAAAAIAGASMPHRYESTALLSLRRDGPPSIAHLISSDEVFPGSR